MLISKNLCKGECLYMSFKRKSVKKLLLLSSMIAISGPAIAVAGLSSMKYNERTEEQVSTDVETEIQENVVQEKAASNNVLLTSQNGIANKNSSATFQTQAMVNGLVEPGSGGVCYPTSNGYAFIKDDGSSWAASADIPGSLSVGIRYVSSLNRFYSFVFSGGKIYVHIIDPGNGAVVEKDINLSINSGSQKD